MVCVVLNVCPSFCLINASYPLFLFFAGVVLLYWRAPSKAVFGWSLIEPLFGVFQVSFSGWRLLGPILRVFQVSASCATAGSRIATPCVWSQGVISWHHVWHMHDRREPCRDTMTHPCATAGSRVVTPWATHARPQGVVSWRIGRYFCRKHIMNSIKTDLRRCAVAPQIIKGIFL